MKNKNAKYASGALLSIAAASVVAAPVVAEENEQPLTDKANENVQPFTPAVFAQAESTEKILYVLGYGSEQTITSTSNTGYSNLKKDLESNQFKVQQKYFEDLQFEDLLQSDIVMLNVHSLKENMNDSDIEMFRDYVYNGGALLLLGDMHATNQYDTDAANNLASIFGIEFLNGLLVDENDNYESGITPYVSNFEKHSITEGIEPFWMNWSTGIKVTSPAKALITSNPGSYLETNTTWSSWYAEWTYSKDNKDIDGPVAVVASSEFGLGRIVAISELGFFRNDWYGQNQSQELMMNMVGWLREASLKKDYVLEAKYPAASTTSKVMSGGSAIRTYMLKDTKGITLKNHSVRYEINGETKLAKSNNIGEIRIITPPLKQVKTHELTLHIVDTDYTTKFKVEVTPRQFEQNWNLTTGVEGKVGLGVGVNAKLGKSNQFKVGADAMIGSGLKSMLTMKYIMDGEYYDLVVEPSISQSAALTGTAGITGKLKPFGQLSLVNLEGEAGTEVFVGGNLTLKDFNNPDNYKNNAAFSLPLMYEILSTATMQNKKLANNQFIQMLMEAIEEQLDKDLYSTMGSFVKVGISGSADLDVIKKELAYKKLGGDIGLFSAGAGFTNELYSEINSKGEQIDRNILNAELKGSSLNIAGKYTTKSDTEFSTKHSMLKKDVKVETTEELISKKGKATQYSYSITSEEDANGAVVGENPEDAITTTKYTLNEKTLEKFATVKGIDKVLNNKFTLFQNPNDTLDSIFNAKIAGEKLQYEELKKVEKEFEFPLEIGLGAGVKVQLGFELMGSSSVEYAAEQGIYETGDGQYITAAYEYDDTVKNQQENLTDVFVSMGEQVGAAIGDVVEWAKDLGGDLIGIVSNTGTTIVNGVTVGYTTVVNGVTGVAEGVTVGLSKVKDFFGFSIQTEDGKALVLGEMFFLSFNGEDGKPLYDLGDGTVPLTLEYTDEIIASLGLQGKEEGLAIYRWDSEKVTYVRMASVVDTKANNVTIETPFAGQYILAYNELNTEVQDVKFEQKGTTLNMKTIVKDSFEYVDPSTIFVHVNDEVYGSDTFEYNASTGELALTLDNMDYYSDVAVQIETQGTLSDVYTHKMLNNYVYPYNSEAQVTEKGAFFNVSFNEPQDVKRATVVYSVNGGSTQYAALEQQGQSWLGAVTTQEKAAQIEYKIQYVTAANEVLESEVETVQASTIQPITLVEDSLTYDFTETSKGVTLTFNHPLSEETSLNDIFVLDKSGKELAVTKSIHGNQLMITPAYEMPTGEISIKIAQGALKADYGKLVENTKAIKYVYESVDMNKLEARTENQPWTITFSRALTQSELDPYIYITDLNGNRIASKAVKLPNNKQVKITPANSYEVGENYILHVTNGVKAGEINLNNNAVKVFTVK